MADWDLGMDLTTNEVRARSQIADDLMFYFVYTPYDGKHENCKYWICPIIYLLESGGYIATEVKLICRSFKENSLESAIRFVENRIATLVEDSAQDDITNFSFNGKENALGWNGYVPYKGVRAIRFFGDYKDESVDVVFVSYADPIEYRLPIAVKDGTVINCGFKKL